MKKQNLGIIYVLLAGMLWGTMGVFVNYFDSLGLGSIDIAATRLAFASLIVSIFIGIKSPKSFKFKVSDIWIFLGTGLISLMIFTVCYFKTIVMSSMSVAAVLLYTSPVFVILLSFIIFKEKITKAKALSCIVCVIGSAFVSGIIGSSANIPLSAFLLGITSGLAYAMYSIFSRFALQKNYKSITITAYTFFFSTLGLAFFVDFNALAECISKNPMSIAVMILSSLITAVLPYFFYTKGLENIDSGKASIVAAIEPVVAVIIGYLYFKDDLSFIQYIGIFLVIISIAIQNAKTHKAN